MNCKLRKCTVWHVGPVKTQLSLCFSAVWTVFVAQMKILCILGYPKCINEESDQTAQMRRLIWIFTRCTYLKVHVLMFPLIWCYYSAIMNSVLNKSTGSGLEKLRIKDKCKLNNCKSKEATYQVGELNGPQDVSISSFKYRKTFFSWKHKNLKSFHL